MLGLKARRGSGEWRLIVRALGVGLILAGQSRVLGAEPANSLESAPVRASQGLSPWLPHPPGPSGYVSASSCFECHRDQFASWHHSHHRSMTQVMSTNSVLADFNGVTLEMHGERFTLRQEGNRFWAEIVDLDQPEAEREIRRLPMEMVTGSHHMQVFWVPAGAGNAQVGFPFTWLIQDRRWVPRESAFIRDPHSEPQIETWNMTCIRCHVTAGQPRPRREEQIFDTRIADFGIACEACHGPGEDHIAFQRRLLAADATLEGRSEPDADFQRTRPGVDPIIQPRKLDRERSAHVCAQCHSIRWFDQREGWAENGFRYRPGDDLEATTPVVRPSRVDSQPWIKRVLERVPNLFAEFFWSDGMIRVAGREFNGLLESACYQRGELSCLSCHSMHEYADRNDQVRPGMEGNRACVQCHDEQRYGERHTHHQPNSPGNLCYNCHMPHTSYALLKAIRQHQIDSPRVSTTLQTGRQNACNLCHQDRSLAWTARQLTTLYGQDPVDVPEERSTVSAVVRDLLSGEAGQRALAAWHLGWAPARELTGSDWQAPLLSRLLQDPYSAVRYIAHHSLRQMPGYGDFPFDFVAAPESQPRVTKDAVARWKGADRPRDTSQRRALLLRDDGKFDEEKVSALLRARDNRPMRLRE